MTVSDKPCLMPIPLDAVRERITKAAAIEESRQIIDQYGFGVPFSDADRRALSRIFGTEVRFATRMRNVKYPNDPRHLHILTGEWTEPQQYSWRAAIDINFARDKDEARLARRRSKLLAALRKEVQPDLDDFRQAQAVRECAQCRIREDLTTDHIDPPFIRIALEFLVEQHDFELRPVRGGSDAIADVAVAAEWITFHARRATYQLLCRSCNSSKGCR